MTPYKTLCTPQTYGRIFLLMCDMFMSSKESSLGESVMTTKEECSFP